MRTIIEKQREIPIAGEYDMIVVGGGFAGVSAAAAAARYGLSTAIIEKSIVLGGLATLGHVCIYLPIDNGLGQKIYGGLAEELLYVCIKYGYDDLPDCWRGGPRYVSHPTGRYRTTFNIPACVLALDEFVQNENVDVIFDTIFCEPVMDGNTCTGVIVENKSGRSAYLAKMFIDASGGSDLLFRAGAECETQKSIISHWAYEFDFSSLRKGLEEENILSAFNLRWLGLRPDADNDRSEIPTFYGTTNEGVNDYIRVSRSLALDYLKKNQSNGYTMMTLPFMPQFRMTRRLKGKIEMPLTEGAYIESSVGCVFHSLESPAVVYEFPYESLIDSKITNIAAAGRMVAAGGRGWEIMRSIPTCAFTGQASATAAATALQTGCTLQNVSVQQIQEKLAASDIMIHMDEELRRSVLSGYVNVVGGNTSDPLKADMHNIKADALSYDH